MRPLLLLGIVLAIMAYGADAASPHPASGEARTAGAAPPFGTPSAPVPAGVDLARAEALISAWEEQQPERAERFLRVLYWTPADTEPNPACRERLTRVMRYARDFYASQLAAYGLGARTIRLEIADDGLLRLRMVRGKLPFAHYRTESGDEVRRDCAAALRAEGIDPDDETLIIFCNLSQWDPVKRTMRQTSPYYAGGTHRNGTAWQVDSALLDPDLLGEKAAKLDDGQYGHISVGRYESIFIGGVVHELGHAIGLPHCSETAAERATRGHSLMGDGNRTMGEELRGEGPGTFLALPQALQLATHVEFSGSVKRMREPAAVAWTDLSVHLNDAGAICVDGAVSGKIPVYAVLGYADPAGDGDYDATVGCAVPEQGGRFALAIPKPERPRAPGGEVRLVACCVNGAIAASAGGKAAFWFVQHEGRIDLTAAQEKLELDAALRRQRRGELGEAQRAQLRPRLRECLARLAAPDGSEGKPEPFAVAAELRTLPLSDARPLSAATGWGGVHVDRLPGNEPLTCDGEVFVHGLFAHAAATYAYRTGKAWERLTGACGIGGGGSGAAVFAIVGDGRELWRTTGEVRPGGAQHFSVPLTGVEQLELKTLPVAAGIGGAWGVWLEPVLERAGAATGGG